MNEPAQPGSPLLSLPSEVKRLICAQLCGHCCALTALETVTGLDEDSSSHLKSLSETCTVLRDVAQPFLYHVPRIVRYSRFLWTIRERPDLADCVRCLPAVRLSLRCLAHDMDQDGVALFREAAAELQMITTQDRPLDDEFEHLLALAAGKRRDDLAITGWSQLTEFTLLLQAMLVASLPRLEILYIGARNADDYFPLPSYHHAKRRINRVGRLASNRCTGSSMPSLRTIILQAWRQDSASWKESSISDYIDAHIDPAEFLFSCADLLHEVIFDSCDAPYKWPFASEVREAMVWSPLQTISAISFHDMNWGDGLSYDGFATMTDVEQETAYSRIRQLATQCTKLTSFKLAVAPMDGPRHANPFSPNRLLQNLLPMSTRLETMSIQMAKVHIKRDPPTVLGADIHRFTRLRQLSLDEMCFCRHWLHDDNDAEDGKLSNSCLVEVLPTTVASLSIRLRRKPRTVPDLVQLGKAAIAGAFPNLKHLTVESYLLSADDGPDPANFFSQRDYWPERLRNPQTAQSQTQALTSVLAEAFRGSKVVLEVTEIQTRQVGPGRGCYVPVL